MKDIKNPDLETGVRLLLHQEMYKRELQKLSLQNQDGFHKVIRLLGQAHKADKNVSELTIALN